MITERVYVMMMLIVVFSMSMVSPVATESKLERLELAPLSLGAWCESQCEMQEDACDLSCLNDECGTPTNEMCSPGCYAGCASQYMGCLSSCASGFPSE